MPGDINEYALSMELALSAGPALKTIASLTKKLETVEQQIQRIGDKFVQIFQEKMSTAIKIVPEIATVTTPVIGMIDVDKDSMTRFSEKVRVSLTTAIRESVAAGFKDLPPVGALPAPPAVPPMPPPAPPVPVPGADIAAEMAALAGKMAEEIASAVGPALAAAIKGAGPSFDSLTAEGMEFSNKITGALDKAKSEEIPLSAITYFQEAERILKDIKPQLEALKFPMEKWEKYNDEVKKGIRDQLKDVKSYGKGFEDAYDEITSLQEEYVEADVYTIKNALVSNKLAEKQLATIQSLRDANIIGPDLMEKELELRKAVGAFDTKHWEKELSTQQMREKHQRTQRKHQEQLNAMVEEGFGAFLIQKYVVDSNLIGRAMDYVGGKSLSLSGSIKTGFTAVGGWIEKSVVAWSMDLNRFAENAQRSGKAVPAAIAKGLRATMMAPFNALTWMVGKFRKLIPTNPGTEPFIKSGESIAKAMGKGINNESDVPKQLLKLLVGDMASTLLGQEKKVGNAAEAVAKSAVPKPEPAAGEGFRAMMTNISAGIGIFTATVMAIPWIAIAKLAVIGVIITGMLTAMVALAGWLASSGVMGVVALIALTGAAIGFAYAVGLLAAALPALAVGGAAAIPVLLTLALVIGVLALSVVAITAFVNAITNLFKAFSENITAGFAFVGFMYALIPALLGLGVAILGFSVMLLASMIPIAAAVAIGAALLGPAVFFALTMTIIAGGVAVFAAAITALGAGISAFTASVGNLGGALTNITTAVGAFGVAIVGFALGLGAALALLLPSILMMPVIIAGLIAFGAGLLGSMILLSIAMFFGTAAVEWLTSFGLALKNISDAIVAMGSPGEKMREIAGGINALMSVKVNPFAVVGMFMVAAGLGALGDASTQAASGIQALAGAGTTITGVVDEVIAKEKDFDRAAGIVERFGNKMSVAFDKVSEKAVAGPFSAESTAKAETVTTVQITSDMARRTSESNRQTLDALTAIKETLEKIMVTAGSDELKKIISALETFLPQIAEGRGGGLVDDINRWKT
jgi:hypothetical protein